MNWLKVLFLLLFCCVLQTSFAQDKSYGDLVYLKNGSVFRGKIIEYTPGEDLKIELYGANVITIQDADIERVVQQVPASNAEGGKDREQVDLMEEPHQPRVLPPLRETGWYDLVQLGFLAATSDGGSVIGLTASNVLGYQWDSRLGAGLGISYDGYRPSRAETIVSVYAEGRVYPFADKLNWFAALGAGYGFAPRSKSLDVVTAQGGLMGTVSIGYRFQTMDQSESLLEYGLRYQDAYFVRDLPNGDIEFRDVQYFRNLLRVSMTLWGRNGR